MPSMLTVSTRVFGGNLQERFMDTVFSKSEKKVIDKMIDLDNGEHLVHLQNILTDETGLLRRFGEFSFCKPAGEVFSLRYAKKLDSSSKDAIKLVRSIEKQLYDVVLLLEALEKKGYILFVDTASEILSEPTICDFKQEIPLDEDLKKRLYKLWNKNIKVLLRLKTLKQHDYLEESLYESRRYNNWFIILTSITILVSLLSIFVNIYLANRKDKHEILIEAETASISVKQKTQ
jgi:hypothetical protein